MKTTNKVFLVGMISAVLAFGFVLASCKQVYEGDSGSLSTSGKKAVTLTLKSTSYSIEYNGKTYSGSAKKEKLSVLGVTYEEWEFTSGGEGYAEVFDKKLADFEYESDDGQVYIYAYNLEKKSLASGEISLDDIELIIEEDEEE